MAESPDTEAIAATLSIAKKTGAVNTWLNLYRRDVNTLLAALATAEERADELAQAIQRMMRWCSPGKTAEQIGTEALANYHKATGPQAAPEIENARPGATGEGS